MVCSLLYLLFVFCYLFFVICFIIMIFKFRSFSGIFSGGDSLSDDGVISIPMGQKQPFKGCLKIWCSENMQQIYRRTPMPKCDFDKVSK